MINYEDKYNLIKEKYKYFKIENIENEITKHKISWDFFDKFPNPNYKTNINVINKDMIEIAFQYFKKYKNKILMLNMANPIKPGGNPNIKGAQEEYLFRNSNIFLYLIEKIYPIKDNEIIYTKNIELITNNKIKEKFNMDIVSCHGIINEEKLFAYKNLKLRLNALFQTAYKNKKKIIILSALGCGGFKNDPKKISKVFNEVLINYKGYFIEIIFVINEKYIYNIFIKSLINSFN